VLEELDAGGPHEDRPDARPDAEATPSFQQVEHGVDEEWALARGAVGAAWAKGRYKIGMLQREARAMSGSMAGAYTRPLFSST